MDTIGKRITEVREDCNITQSALANAIGVTKSTMSKYEKDICIPKSDILALIADVLNTSTDYLTVMLYHKS